MPLPAPLVPRSEVALIDEAAAAMGLDIAALMECAGAALAHEAKAMAPEGRIVIACGPGNNGGDGYVCARLLAASGRSVAVWPVVEPKSPLCQRQAASLPATIERLDGIPPGTPLLVDAILGAGVTGRPREPVARALRQIRESGTIILSADVPTGLGTELMLPAKLTVCFQVAKSELLGIPGLGEFKTVDIGIPAAAYKEVQPACMRRYPALKRTGHKGSHGELLIVAGGVFPGALEFAARAAVISGCDMVRAWTADGPPLPATVVVNRQGASLTAADPEELTPLLVRASTVLIGPGLGRAPGIHELIHQVFSLAQEMGVPVVVDADAITVLADTLRALPKGDGQVLVTPHRGEARILLGGATDELGLHAFARPDRVVLAKGPVDLVSDGRRWQRNP
nr:NAD(P)H-hydrate epimerase [Planctomycetota bacterium]